MAWATIVVLMSSQMTFGGEPDYDTPPEKVAEFREKALKGDPVAQYDLAWLTILGWAGVPKDSIKGQALFMQSAEQGYDVYRISAKTGLGVEELKQHLKSLMGYQSNLEGGFIARRRHLEALDLAESHLMLGKEQLEVYLAGELLAEELRMCQMALSEITGKFTSDDLLGKIFSSFCIGK